MGTKEPEGLSGNMDLEAAADRPSEARQETLPVDYWSVNKRAPTTTNDDLSESQWKQVRHLVQVQWSRIEDDEVAGIEGKASRLASLLQRRYGYTEDRAESQSIRWMRQHRDEQDGTSQAHSTA